MITKTRAGIAVGCAMLLLTLAPRAPADQPCEKCVGAGMFNPVTCPGGTDQIDNSTVELGVRFDASCGLHSDAILNFAGPFTVQRQAAAAGVIDAEITQMSLAGGGGVTLVAGAGLGQGGVLQPSLGTTTDIGGGTGNATFDVFFEVDLGGGTYVYNWDPLVLEANISCLPPDQTFEVVNGCLTMYATPPMLGGSRGDPELTVSGDPSLHDPYPIVSEPIPTVSEWSLIIMTVLAMTAGTILISRRRRAAA